MCFELKLLRYILLVKQETEHSTQTDNLLSSLILIHIVCEIADAVKCLRISVEPEDFKIRFLTFAWNDLSTAITLQL